MEEYLQARVDNIAKARDCMRFGLEGALYVDFPLKYEWDQIDPSHAHCARKMINDLDVLRHYVINRPAKVTAWVIKVHNALDDNYMQFQQDFEELMDGIGNMLVKGLKTFNMPSS